MLIGAKFSSISKCAKLFPLQIIVPILTFKVSISCRLSNVIKIYGDTCRKCRNLRLKD